MGYPPRRLDEPINDRLERDYFEPARARYGSEAWRHAEQAGAALSREQAIAYALEQSTTDGSRNEGPRSSPALPPLM
jgi:hypothetical protein